MACLVLLAALQINQFQGHDFVWTQNGATVLQYFSLDYVNASHYITYLSLFFFAYLTLAYLAMSCLQHQKR